MIVGALSRWRARRRPLIEAQRAIFRLQDVEDAAGIDYESDEYLRLHRELYALLYAEPWWVRIGVWRQALREHEASGDHEEGASC